MDTMETLIHAYSYREQNESFVWIIGPIVFGKMSKHIYFGPQFI